MPQLVKGGKYIFGWAVLKNGLTVRIPGETCDEYKFEKSENVVLLPGSNTSGGFIILRTATLKNSVPGKRISQLINYSEESGAFLWTEPKIIQNKGKIICCTYVDSQKNIRLSKEIVGLFQLQTGNKLLVGRGSGLGPACIAKGPIYREALKHEDLLIF